MKFNWKKLYGYLNKRRKAEGMSWRKLATSMKVTPSAFTRISQEQPVSVQNLVKIVGWCQPDVDLWDFCIGKQTHVQ